MVHSRTNRNDFLSEWFGRTDPIGRYIPNKQKHMLLDKHIHISKKAHVEDEILQNLNLYMHHGIMYRYIYMQGPRNWGSRGSPGYP